LGICEKLFPRFVQKQRWRFFRQRFPLVISVHKQALIPPSPAFTLRLAFPLALPSTLIPRSPSPPQHTTPHLKPIPTSPTHHLGIHNPTAPHITHPPHTPRVHHIHSHIA